MNSERRCSAVLGALLLVAANLLTGCQTPGGAPSAKPAARKAEPPLQRIAFGSCAHQDKDPSFWNTLRAQRPDVFVFLGDTVYADTRDREVLAATYAKLGALPEYQAFRQQCPVLAIWDDHDYGENDAGREYPLKAESKEVFLDFFGEPENSPRRARPGNYAAVVLGPAGKRTQIILLDTRWFRDPLLRRPLALPGEGPFEATPDEESTLLGEEQWAWLEQQLQVPAEFRLLVSSIQVVAEEHRWEKWGNFPHERQRLLALLQRSGVQGLLVISGDRHHAEVSQMDAGLGYPLYDITSSSLNAPKVETVREPNRYRIAEAYAGPNFGMLRIDWKGPDPVVTVELRDAKSGNVFYANPVRRSELQPPPPEPPAAESAPAQTP